jgi:L-ascorbate metabolism protein UlaG (beta-lactamase superfamily)
MPNAKWKHVADWAKRRPATLRVADFLGRGTGRVRVLDRIGRPPASPHRPDLSRWAEHELAAAWLGHATVLLRIGGKTVITDPVLSSRVGLGLGLMTGGPRRMVAAALSVRQLPPLDLILLSHAHFDHLDRPTLVRMDRSVPVVAAHATADLVADLGFKHVTELRWGDSTVAAGLTVTAVPVKHWGARTFYDQHRGYNAYRIDAPATGDRPGRRVLYGGDTAFHTGFAAAGPVDLAILGIGAYDPYVAAHATPEQALAMADQVQAAHVLPMHHSTFRLSYEPTHDPIRRLLAAAGPEGAGRVVIREVGQQWAI